MLSVWCAALVFPVLAVIALVSPSGEEGSSSLVVVSLWLAVVALGSGARACGVARPVWLWGRAFRLDCCVVLCDAPL